MLRGLTLSLLSSSSHTFSTWNSTSSVVWVLVITALLLLNLAAVSCASDV
jgi:hypothetical protein